VAEPGEGERGKTIQDQEGHGGEDSSVPRPGPSDTGRQADAHGARQDQAQTIVVIMRARASPKLISAEKGSSRTALCWLMSERRLVCAVRGMSGSTPLYV